VTAPSSAIAQISAQIASVQARIAAVTQRPVAAPAPAATAATTSTTGTTSAAAFATQYATATGSTTPTAASAPAAGDPSGTDVVADAKQYLGIPYVWGGETTTGMDCSGLVQKTFADLGVHLPRVAADQAHEGTPVASMADARPGDLLFFGEPAYHVAIYAGDGKLIESPEPGKTVHVTDVYQTPTSIRRIVDDAGSSAPVAAGGLSADALTAAGLNAAVAGFAPQFASAESHYHLPAGLLAAVAQQESGGNPSALSPAGAEGLMQLMPSTAAGLGVNPNDPDQAIDAAGRILAGNLSRFHGSVPLALAAYNAGAGAVEQYGGIPPYAETQNYVRSITAMMAAGG
jgi:cell wall-associated NlpC family hydrolase